MEDMERQVPWYEVRRTMCSRSATTRTRLCVSYLDFSCVCPDEWEHGLLWAEDGRHVHRCDVGPLDKEGRMRLLRLLELVDSVLAGKVDIVAVHADMLDVLRKRRKRHGVEDLALLCRALHLVGGAREYAQLLVLPETETYAFDPLLAWQSFEGRR